MSKVVGTGEPEDQRVGYDVFVSYSREDREWVRVLAENLHQAGLGVFYDEWEIGPGDVLVHRVDEGLGRSRSGVVVVSPSALSSLWVNAEYAALMTRAVEGEQRLVPVLLEDAELPPLLASRVWVDFRGVDGPEYERRLRELVTALRGERPGPPARTGVLEVPPGGGFEAEGALRWRLQIGVDEVVLLDDERGIGHRPRGLSVGDVQRLWELERRRRHWREVVTRAAPESQAPAEVPMQSAQLEMGALLGRVFLAGAAGEVLREQVAEAERRNVPLELGVEVVDEELENLPWETLRLPAGDGEPGVPLVLHPRVSMYRGLAEAGSSTAIPIRGPLRVLVAIGSPESRGGELLDMEAELAQILDAVEASRRAGRAYVRILNRGTVSAIHQALMEERYHVLHVSCHARPGALVLEDEEGGVDEVDAGRFVDEVLPGGRGVPLVVLAGCATALSERGGEKGEAALPGLARGLLARGVPAVLAMNTTVSDPYATRLLARFYGALAMARRPDALSALSEARRDQEQARRREPAGSPLQGLAEWATPVLLSRARVLPLYDAGEGFERIEEVPEPRFQPGIVVRRVGEFVGRRREERQLLRALRGERAGVVIHGLGGVGKSTLSAQLVSELAREPLLVIPIAGATGVDQVLHEAGLRLLALCMERGLDEKHPYRELSGVLRDPRNKWSERLSLLSQLVLGQERAVLLLDNFEDNLEAEADGSWRVSDAALAELLAAWVRMRGRSHVVVTSRHPFQLPGGMEGRLERHHLGPLSLAETRKLIWRLPGLDGLGREERVRAYADVGGHPRTLEYLDALLRGGQARFDDVAERMERALAKKGVERPRAWLREAGRDLDRALAEAVTLAVDDVVLGELLARLEGVELARQLLVGASVYREPVDEVGLAWQVSEEVEVPADPERKARLARLHQAQGKAKAAGRSTKLEEVGLAEEDVRLIDEDWRRAKVPPLHVPVGLGEARTELEDLGLLAPVEDGERGRRYLVHRWTARELAGLAEPRDLVASHQHAANYWRWRVRAWPRSLDEVVEQMLEVRHHLHAVGDVTEAARVTADVITQLHTWRAYDWEERLCLETLGWLPERSFEASVYLNQLGVIAHLRGDYVSALKWYQRSWPIMEAVGHRGGLVACYDQMGALAELRREYDVALDLYHRSLAIAEELGDRAVIALGCHHIGMVAEARGDHDTAVDWFRRAVSESEEAGDLAGIARGYHQLGIVAEARGDYPAAVDWCSRSLPIAKDLRDQALLSRIYFHLGTLAQRIGEYDQAQDWCRDSLSIGEELRDPTIIALNYHQLGRLAQARGDHDAARDWYHRSLAISEKLGNQADMLETHLHLGIMAADQGAYDAALVSLHRSLSIAEELGDRANTGQHLQQSGRRGREAWRLRCRRRLVPPLARRLG